MKVAPTKPAKEKVVKETESKASRKDKAAAPAAEKEGGKEESMMFGGLILKGSMAKALKKKGITKATEVQEIAMTKIARGKRVCVLSFLGC